MNDCFSNLFPKNSDFFFHLGSSTQAMSEIRSIDWPEFECRPPSVARISELIEYLRSRSWNCSVCPWKKKFFKRGGDD